MTKYCQVLWHIKTNKYLVDDSVEEVYKLDNIRKFDITKFLINFSLITQLSMAYFKSNSPPPHWVLKRYSQSLLAIPAVK